MGKWENDGKTMGKWENHRKTIGKWENHRKTIGNAKIIGKPWEKRDLYGTSPSLIDKSTMSMGHFQ